jgi:hypothetical protein
MYAPLSLVATPELKECLGQLQAHKVGPSDAKPTHPASSHRLLGSSGWLCRSAATAVLGCAEPAWPARASTPDPSLLPLPPPPSPAASRGGAAGGRRAAAVAAERGGSGAGAHGPSLCGGPALGVGRQVGVAGWVRGWLGGRLARKCGMRAPPVRRGAATRASRSWVREARCEKGRLPHICRKYSCDAGKGVYMIS